MGIIILMLLSVCFGCCITCFTLAVTEPKPKKCSNCKKINMSCGGSAFGPCERWAKK